METPKIHESEYRFCLVMWENEPIRSPELAKLCLEKLGWKLSTTYTVMKRLEERGVLKVENKIVTSLFSKDQIQQAELDEFMNKTFEGSLPAFIAAFGKRQALSDKDIEEIRRIIQG
ncbi:MAG: BlaI/MecI/CopY family transcriptional regulator [Oscillospiraceae bacterium]|nr:BlaI/MecI/CopY family transcriptional regulator [Oscillospiraceae bacterium]